MDIKVVNPQGSVQELKDQTVNTPETIVTGQDNQLDRIAIGQMFDMDIKSISKDAKKIDTLIQWAKDEAKTDDMMQLKWVIKNLEAKLGSPNFGETRLTKLHRYAYLDIEGKKMEAEKLSLVK